MKISGRGWIVLLVGGAAIAAAVTYGLPQLHAAQPASPQSGALTQESLGQLLQAMGLKPTLVEKRYDFAFKAIHNKEEWQLSMSAVLSQDGQWLWIMAWLDELPRSAADVPRTALLRLLADNDILGEGKFFAYIAANRRFVLQRAVKNEGFTTGKMQRILQDLGASVVETYPHWSVANWKAGSNLPTASGSSSGPPASRAAIHDPKLAPRSRN